MKVLKHIFLPCYRPRCWLEPLGLSNTNIKVPALVFAVGQFLKAQGEETQQFSVAEPSREVCEWQSSPCTEQGGAGIWHPWQCCCTAACVQELWFFLLTLR